MQCQLHVRYGILLYLYQHPHIFISLYQSHGDILSLYYYVNFVIYVSDLGFLVKFYRTILYIGLLAYTCSLDTIALMNISDGNGILGHFSESSILIIRKLSGYVTVFVKYNFCVLSFSFYAQVYLVYMMKTPITLEFRQVLIRFNHPFVSEN